VGIRVYWDNSEKTILRQDYGAMWEWEEYEASFAEIHAHVGEVDHPIGIIADVGKIGRIPPDAIMHGSRAVRELPDRVSLCVVVTPSRLTMMILQAIRAVTRYDKIRIAPSIDQARHLIAAELGLPNPNT
jgi:hypothetical protein